MLKRLTVENYRSLERVQVALHSLTAFVGANGTGKSSLLRAIDLVLGQRYPSVNSRRFPQDFTLADDQRELRIAVRFAEPWVHVDAMDKPHEIHGLQVSCRPYRRRTARAEPGDPNFDYEPLANDGSVPQGVALSRQQGRPVFGPLIKVPPELREATQVLFIDHRRSLRDHQPWARGSILARLLGPARRELGSVEFAEGRSHAAEFSER